MQRITNRNFFPKTNERQPLVDVSGFGPSFTTTFFDELDLHSGFFDHNFPGSPQAEDYKLNFKRNRLRNHKDSFVPLFSRETKERG